MDPAEGADDHVASTKAFWNASAPYSTGVYVNHLDGDDQPRVRTAFGSKYQRLAAVKRRYDPENLFRHNNNIEPAWPV